VHNNNNNSNSNSNNNNDNNSLAVMGPLVTHRNALKKTEAQKLMTSALCSWTIVLAARRGSIGRHAALSHVSAEPTAKNWAFSYAISPMPNQCCGNLVFGKRGTQTAKRLSRHMKTQRANRHMKTPACQ